MRTKPNIVVSGTPGTGKTTLARKVAEALEGYEVIDFGAESIAYDENHPANEQIREWHEESQSHNIDCDTLVESLKPRVSEGGKIIDWMHGDIWPNEGLIDLVITVHANNTVLFDRYTARGYSQSKIDENIDSEIFGSIASENREYWQEEYDTLVELLELESNTPEELESNIDKVVEWVNNWRPNTLERYLELYGDTQPVSNTDGAAESMLTAADSLSSTLVTQAPPALDFQEDTLESLDLGEDFDFIIEEVYNTNDHNREGEDDDDQSNRSTGSVSYTSLTDLVRNQAYISDRFRPTFSREHSTAVSSVSARDEGTILPYVGGQTVHHPEGIIIRDFAFPQTTQTPAVSTHESSDAPTETGSEVLEATAGSRDDEASDSSLD